jgi:Holliday junction resolvase RusA-like endonuclease
MYIRIYGNPVAQGRPRAFRRGNHIGMYDPQKSKSWKDTICWQAAQQKAIVMDGALILDVIFILERPKSLPKKTLWHIKRPDLDNLVKAVKDALNGICYRDDSQIVDMYAKKRYATPEEGVGVIIRLEKMKGL